MVERATKENIQRILSNILEEYGISVEQVLSVAHDNGQNMVASVKLLKKLINTNDDTVADEPYCLKAEKELLDEFSENNSENATIEECDEINDESEENIEEIEFNDDFNDGQPGTGEINSNNDDDENLINVDLLESTRCAVHTAQLAVWDVLKSYKPRMAAINKIGITMRHKLHRQLFTIHKVPLPPKVVETRWNIWYLLNMYVFQRSEGSSDT